MGCVEGSGVPVLYIGRTVPKGDQGGGYADCVMRYYGT
jgi:hypothetical protein